ATLKIEKTIPIDKSKPSGIQATDDGYVFLNSGEGQWTHVYLVNANRDPKGKTLPVVSWAGVYHTNSIRLSPDQKTLYTACFSLSPSNITSFQVPEQPAFLTGQQNGGISIDAFNVRGQMEISRDGRFMLCDRGLFLSLGR